MIEILIVGSGALANAFAARLYLPDQCHLQVYGSWQAGIQAIALDGVQLTRNGQTSITPPIFATSDPRQIRPADLMLFLVKSWQTRLVANELRQKLNPSGVCLTLQNGLGNLEILEDVFGKEQVNAGTTTLGATLNAPGQVQIHAEGSIALGEHPSNTVIIPLFTACGFELHSHADLQSVLWGKLLINAIINPLTALLEVENGALERHEQTMLLVDQMIDEILCVVNALHIKLPYTDPHAQIRKIIHESGYNHSSMVQDIQRNAPTEIDFITGAILREAEKLNLELPVNKAIYRLIKSKILLQSNPFRTNYENSKND